MIVENQFSTSAIDDQAPTHVVARDLLLACIAEAERHAFFMKELDLVLGAAFGADRRSASVSDFVKEFSMELQKADIIRQELEGLSSLLKLLESVATLEDSISYDRIQLCSPLADMQRRLLNYNV